MHPLGAAATRHDHRAMTSELAPCQTPSQYPHCEGLRPSYCIISLGEWLPRTAKPNARTETTLRTIAGRAFMVSACGNDGYPLKAEKLRHGMPFIRETPSSPHRPGD